MIFLLEVNSNMKIRYQYTNYSHSKAATSWSRFRGSLTAACIFIVFLLTIGINSLLKSLIGGTDRYIVSLILSIVIYFGFLFFCKHQEEVCSVCDLEKQRLGRDLTAEEKKQAILTLKRTKKNKAVQENK